MLWPRNHSWRIQGSSCRILVTRVIARQNSESRALRRRWLNNLAQLPRAKICIVRYFHAVAEMARSWQKKTQLSGQTCSQNTQHQCRWSRIITITCRLKKESSVQEAHKLFTILLRNSPRLIEPASLARSSTAALKRNLWSRRWNRQSCRRIILWHLLGVLRLGSHPKSSQDNKRNG